MTEITLGQALDALAVTVAQKAEGDPTSSYTAELVRDGVARCAKKLGEEGVEAALAAVSGDRDHLAEEAGDLLYHLLVTLQCAGVPPARVAEVLRRRTGVGGLTEKAARTD